MEGSSPISDPRNPPPKLPLNPCGAGFTYWKSEDSCFKILPEPVTYSQAIDACKALGGKVTLASLNSPWEAAYAEGLMVEAAANEDGSIPVEKPLWIGINDRDVRDVMEKSKSATNPTKSPNYVSFWLSHLLLLNNFQECIYKICCF